jgi:uncharacterized membrane protein
MHPLPFFPRRGGFGDGILPFGDRGAFLAPGPGHDGLGALEWAIFAIVLATLIAVVFALASRFARHRPPHWGRFAFAGAPPVDPVGVVRMRYARGEVSRDEYLQATRDLGGEPEAEPPPSEPS